MANWDEIAEALVDYQQSCNSNQRLRRVQRDWSKLINFTCLDDPTVIFQMTVVKGEITEWRSGYAAQHDIHVRATSEDFADMFWGDLNPSRKYLQGEIKVEGSQEDVMRLDAITSIIWPDV
jgi:putative sterol carrier protein